MIKSESYFPLIRETLQSYLKTKLTDFEYIYLDIAKEETKIHINDIRPPIIRLSDDSWNYKEKADDDNSILSPLTLIVGEAGEGKSTFCKWVFNRSVSEEILEGEAEIFPLYIDLRFEFSLGSFLVKEVGAFNYTFKEIIAELKKMIPLFICDGLDELRDKTPDIIKDIKNIGKLLPNYRVFVTSRPCNYVGDFVALGYTRYDIEINDTAYLPIYLIKDKDVRGDFYVYSLTVYIKDSIRLNYLLYTFFILCYLKSSLQDKFPSRISILKNVLEDYFWEKWEFADIQDKLMLPKNRTCFPDVLSSIALLNNFRKDLLNYVKPDFPYYKFLIETDEGVTDACLQEIIEIRYGSIGEVANQLVNFFCESGVLSINMDGNYVFSNRTYEEYFLAKAIARICFDEETFYPFTLDKNLATKLINSFMNGSMTFVTPALRNSLRDNVAGFLKNPSKILRRFFDYGSPRKMIPHNSYFVMLVFLVMVIRERKNEIDPTIKNPILRQLIFYTRIIYFPTDEDLRLRQALEIYEIAAIDFMTILLMSEDFICIEITMDYFFLNSQQMQWNRLSSFLLYFGKHKHERLIEYCTEPNKHEGIEKWRVWYLNYYAPESAQL